MQIKICVCSLIQIISKDMKANCGKPHTNNESQHFFEFI